MDPQTLRFIKKAIIDFGSEFEDNRVVMQFIPIILVLLLSLYTRRFVEVGHSVLGKLFAVVIIIFYTKLNMLYGVFACVVIILFYQLTEGTIVEGMKKSKKSQAKQAVPPKPPPQVVPPPAKQAVPPPAKQAPLAAAAGTATATVPSGQSAPEEEDDKDVEDGTNLPDDSNDDSNDVDTEGFEPYQSIYPVINIEDFNAAKEEFIKEKCKNGIVMYKDMPVKPEMVDHIFSEVNFTTKTKCNPCDRTCAYSIVESKMATEEELSRPKNSNDVFEWLKQLM
jgi:hypothetical protein